MIQPETQTTDDFSRLDEADDRLFYSTDRLIGHIDATAQKTLSTMIGQLVVEEAPVVLDLMASWDSHIPKTVTPAHVTGLGLNENELAANQALGEWVIHDLNRMPELPLRTAAFDLVLCTLSVDYLIRPVEVFRDVGRVLKPGGLFLIAFSNRFFPPKVVKIWRESGEAERIDLVTDFLNAAGDFDPPAVFVSKGRPRPEDDAHAGTGLPSDPVYAVYAERNGGHNTPRPLPTGNDHFPTPDPDLVRRRRATVARTLTCPHCNQQLDMWRVPHTPFTQWSSEYQYLCFNDDCPFFVRGWGAMISQGIPGSYRFMFDPDSGTCHSAPVLTPQSLRESIVSR